MPHEWVLEMDEEGPGFGVARLLLGGSWVVISGVISPPNMGYNYGYPLIWCTLQRSMSLQTKARVCTGKVRILHKLSCSQ